MNISNIISHNIKKISISKAISAITKNNIILIFSIFLIIASCSNEGCVEADDFGEYQSTTIQVPSKLGLDYCNFDESYNSDPFNEKAEHSEKIKSCLKSGVKNISISVNDKYETYTNKDVNSSLGCSSGNFYNSSNAKADDLLLKEIRTACISQCKTECLNSNATDTVSLQSEPNWIYTTLKIDRGISINPESEIIIRAVGNIDYSSKVQSSKNFAIDPKRKDLHIFDPLNSNAGIAVKSGTLYDVNVQGEYLYKDSQNKDIYYGTNIITNNSTVDLNYSNKASLQSFANRLLVFAKSNKYPAISDATSRNFDGFAGKIANETNIGLVNIDDIANYKAKKSCEENNFVFAGGQEACYYEMKLDEAKKLLKTYYPGYIIAIGAVNNNNNNGETTLGYKKNNKSAVMSAGSSFFATFEEANIKIPLYNSLNEISWKIIDFANSEDEITLLSKNDAKYYLLLIPSKIWLPSKFTAQTSGFVRFINNNSSQECNISGRIVNNQEQYVSGQLNPEYYEYEASSDPLKGFIKLSSNSLNSSSNEFFIRKGQSIILSWFQHPQILSSVSALNNYFTKCLNNIAIYIDPRPAAFCSGSSQQRITNPECFVYFNKDKKQVGCQPRIPNISSCSEDKCPPQCLKYKAGDNYIDILSCQDGTEVSCPSNKTNFFCRKCNYDSNKITNNPDNLCKSPSTITRCTTCIEDQKKESEKPYQILAPVDLCYNLDNYNKKFSSFAQENESTKLQFLLKSFDGSSGNIGDLAFKQISEANNKPIYKLANKFSVKEASLIKMVNIFNEDFISLSKNSSGEYKYTNINQIDSGLINFSIDGSEGAKNGEWLEARLCNSLDNGCFTEKDAKYDLSPRIVKIDKSKSNAVSGQINTADSLYKFDDYGSLLRFGPANQGDCTIKENGIGVIPNINIYCHKNGVSLVDNIKKYDRPTIDNLKFAFKFHDPEIGNCYTIDGSTQTQSGAVFDGIKMANINPYCSKNTNNDKYTEKNNTFEQNNCCFSNDSFCNNKYLYENATDAAKSNVCSLADFRSGKCAKKEYCESIYANNTGSYNVRIKVKNIDTTSSQFVKSVVDSILEFTDGTYQQQSDGSYRKVDPALFENYYKALVTDYRYLAILNIAMTMSIMFYGLGYLLGINKMNFPEVISKITKIGFIYLLAGVSGWSWFNMLFVDFFKNGTNYLTFQMASAFDSSAALAIANANGNYQDKSVLFSASDEIFTMFFSPAVQKKVLGLLFAGLFGWVYLIIIYSAFMLYIFAIASALLTYLTAQIFISILFMLAPILLIFMLFGYTKEMFDNWLKQLVSLSLQQIFLLTTLALFNILIYQTIKNSLGYRVCWDDVWTINIGITRITLLSFWTIPSMAPRDDINTSLGDMETGDGVPSLFAILSIWAVASMMKYFVSFANDLASSIGGGISANTLSRGIATAASNAYDKFGKATKAVTSIAWNNTGGRLLDKIDDKLFDSGDTADKRRNDQTKKDVADQKLRDKFSKVGDRAMSDYRIANANNPQALTRENIAKVRDDAVAKYAQLRGIDQERVDAIQSSKGSRYNGENAFKALWHAGTSKNVFLSNKDKPIKTALSNKEAKTAMASMDKSQRDDFIRNIDKGKDGNKIAVRGSGIIARITDNFRDIGGNIRSYSSDIKERLTGEVSASGNITKENIEEAKSILEKSGKISKINQFSKPDKRLKYSKEEEEKKEFLKRNKRLGHSKEEREEIRSLAEELSKNNPEKKIANNDDAVRELNFTKELFNEMDDKRSNPNFKDKDSDKTYKLGSWKNKLLGDKKISTRLKEAFYSDRSSNNLTQEPDKAKSKKINKLLKAKIEKSMQGYRYNDINDAMNNDNVDKMSDTSSQLSMADTEERDGIILPKEISRDGSGNRVHKDILGDIAEEKKGDIKIPNFSENIKNDNSNNGSNNQ